MLRKFFRNTAPGDQGNDRDRDPMILTTTNLEGASDADWEAFTKTAAEFSDIPVFEGHVEHGYDAAFVEDPTRCPRCGNETRQGYANFVYATQLAPRVMYAPAGHFCTKCPCVVVDQEMLRACVANPRHKFQSVLGIDHGRSNPPDYFRTWNGHDAVYVIDEDERVLGLTSADIERPHAKHAPPVARGKSQKQKNRKKMAKRTRRANRKR